jgi:glyoxylase-like metal-dependent hydrolase (beta-lactamase superfamily II)
VTGELTLIDLDQPITGYRNFLSCWVWQSEELNYIVDPGPNSTIEHLLAELDRLGLARLDYILLTHIHLDHAGGTARVLEKYPRARVFCHPSGTAHLTAPGRLWQGSQKVLGEVAAVYGEPGPVFQESLCDEAEIGEKGIRVLATPGHAPHHVSFVHGDLLYAGEALGTRLPLPSGKPYLRPATPPRFFLEQAVSSLDLLHSLEPQPTRTAIAHWGLVDGARQWCLMAREQILLWVDAVRDLVQEGSVDLEQALFARLQDSDPYFGRGNFDELDEDLKQRERHFLGNTLAGIRGYLQK